MDSDLPAITYIRIESTGYSEKTLWVWYAMQAPGAGAKRCCVPKVKYFGSRSEEKALRIWIAMIFWNLGAQYTVKNFLWLWGVLWYSSCIP